MSRILVPSRHGNSKTVRQYVEAYLTQMRAPLREATHFVPGLRPTAVRRSGERVIYAPDGTPIRVVELPAGGTQVEHGDHLHAHIRPPVVERSAPLPKEIIHALTRH